MKILLSGGGTGGHITPVIAVAREIKKQVPSSYIIYAGERNAKYSSMINDSDVFDEVVLVHAGKFRRYNGESWITRLTDIKTLLLNFRDLFLFIIGLMESISKVRKLKPDVVFLKGGFVGVPVGLASAIWRKKIITHDSDAIPGLANKIVSRWATYHATGMPSHYYKYDEAKVRYVGVLVDSSYKKVDNQLKNSYKAELGIDKNYKVMLVTGGSNGSHTINIAVKQIVESLLSKHKNLYIIHQTGKTDKDLYNNFAHERLTSAPLLKNMYKYSGASDLIVTRAGANTMAEFGFQAKACIVIPNPLLAGGHQLKNAEVLIEQSSALVLNEAEVKNDSQVLSRSIEHLLSNPDKAMLLAKNLHTNTKLNATQQLAGLIIDVARSDK